MNISLIDAVILIKKTYKLFTARTEGNQNISNRPKEKNILTVNEKTSLSTFQFMKS